MNPREQGFLLLSSWLGDPDRRPLTAAQLRMLAQRIAAAEKPRADRELEAADLVTLGYSASEAQRILRLLGDTQVMEHYLRGGKNRGCFPLTRVSGGYPCMIREKLGLDAPGCLWTKGELSILDLPRLALVGSREICPENRRFAREAGRQAALQGYALVSGNARGADKIAQEACLVAGGKVICVVADELQLCRGTENVLFVSEEGFDLPFTPQRALSRNRVIHAMAEKTLVAQCAMGKGGTWDGTVKNLRHGWSSVYCFDDGSAAMTELEQLGAHLIGVDALTDLKNLPVDRSLFD